MVDAKRAPGSALSLWHRVWPSGALIIAVLVNLIWIVLLGYMLAKLL
jgi:hypothetical protein